jgi:hypothetical protein
MSIVPPATAIESMLTGVDDSIAEIVGDTPADVVTAWMGIAQVKATCALVHAVRELTETIRTTGKEEAADET